MNLFLKVSAPRGSTDTCWSCPRVREEKRGENNLLLNNRMLCKLGWVTGKVSFTFNEGGWRCGRVALVQVLQLDQEGFCVVFVLFWWVWVVLIPWIITCHKSILLPLGCCVKPQGSLGQQCSNDSFSSPFFTEESVLFIHWVLPSFRDTHVAISS